MDGSNIWKTEKGLFLSCSSFIQSHSSLNIEIEVITLKELDPALYPDSYLVKGCSLDGRIKTQSLHKARCCIDHYNKENQPDACENISHLFKEETDDQSEMCVSGYRTAVKRGCDSPEKSVDLCDIKVDLNNELMLLIDDEKSFTCNNSSKEFKAEKQLNKQSLIHKDKRTFSCNHCDRKFIHTYHLNQHKLIHNDKKHFICGLCNKRFTCRYSLNRHKLLHNGTISFVCDVCEKGFKQLSNLKRHKFIHTREKPFVCGICEKRFGGIYHLMRHGFIHSGERPFVCEICNKGYSAQRHLKRHTRNKH